MDKVLVERLRLVNQGIKDAWDKASVDVEQYRDIGFLKDDIEKIEGDAEAEINKVADKAKKQRMEGGFEQVKARSHIQWTRVDKRLRDEQRMMMEERIGKANAATVDLDKIFCETSPKGPHDIVLDALAKDLFDRYKDARVGGRGFLSRAIKLQSQALDQRPRRGDPLRDGAPGHPARAESLSNLATCVRERYRLEGSRDDLEESMKLRTEALELRPPGHPDRAWSLSDLASSLVDRYRLEGSRDDLEKSMKLRTEALELRPPGHPDRAWSLSDLASSLVDRYRLEGSRDDLEKSMKLITEALELRPPSHPDRAWSLSDLASSLVDRYRLEGSRDDLEKSMKLITEALELRPPSHPDRAWSLNDLASSFVDRYWLEGSRDDLEESMKLRTEALELRPPGHPDRAWSLNDLASSFVDRYWLEGSHDDLEESMKLRTEALELRPPGHPDRAWSLSDLASSLVDRYRLEGSRDDLEESMKLRTEALELRPPGHPDRAWSLNDLASSFRDRYQLEGSRDDLEKMIELETEALELRPPGHPGRAQSLNNLARSFTDRYRLAEGSRNDLEKSIELHTKALELRLPGHSHRPSTIAAYAEALWDPDTTTAPANASSVFALLREGCMNISFPSPGSLRCARLWAKCACEINDGPKIREAYEICITNLERYLSISPTTARQYEALHHAAAHPSLPFDAASRILELGELGDVETAVKWLDASRSLLWSQMQRSRAPLPPDIAKKLTKLDANLVYDFQKMCYDLQGLSALDNSSLAGGRRAEQNHTIWPYVDHNAQRRALSTKLERLVAFIQGTPGCENFLRPLPFNKLKEAASEGPVIIVNSSKYSSHTILVFADRDPIALPLDDNFHEIALNKCYSYVEAHKGIDKNLESITRWLWDSVVARVVGRLEQEGVRRESRIWWCPTGMLTVLPFHAAGDGKDFLIDYYISSYTPTLKSLIAARQSTDPHGADAPDAPLAHPKTLLVAQTKDRNIFPNASKELRFLRHILDDASTTCLDNEQATKESVLWHLRSHDWVHFICLGVVSDASPFQSSLQLYRDRSQQNEQKAQLLDLDTIISAQLPDAKFAFLAACGVSQQSSLRHEVLHLAGAFQISCFRSVVGNLWPVNDEDGPRVASHFYEAILEKHRPAGQEHKRAAHALWRATQFLRCHQRVPLERWSNFVHIGA
ncbi:hypothetical protein HGRIS_001694 [Hohenbuehelia grisea]|uniref:CHAT domain-containing protein n=1 Tax=Hohenbuehelia grisea TaxID=104357 RepID=A0ABR3JID5_9AGAR